MVNVKTFIFAQDNEKVMFNFIGSKKDVETMNWGFNQFAPRALDTYRDVLSEKMTDGTIANSALNEDPRNKFVIKNRCQHLFCNYS